MRDNSWLEKRLDIIWNKYFTDVPRKNRVSIRFGRAATYRFGSIRQSYIDVSTQIIINGRFKSSNLPQRIVDHTIAHELVVSTADVDLADFMDLGRRLISMLAPYIREVVDKVHAQHATKQT